MSFNRLYFNSMRRVCPAKPAMTDNQNLTFDLVCDISEVQIKFSTYSESLSPELSNSVFGSSIGAIAWQIARGPKHPHPIGRQGQGIPHRERVICAHESLGRCLDVSQTCPMLVYWLFPIWYWYRYIARQSWPWQIVSSIFNCPLTSSHTPRLTTLDFPRWIVQWLSNAVLIW